MKRKSPNLAAANVAGVIFIFFLVLFFFVIFGVSFGLFKWLS